MPKMHVSIKQTPKATSRDGYKRGVTLGSDVQGSTPQQVANLKIAIEAFYCLPLSTTLIGDGDHLDGILVNKIAKFDEGADTWHYVLYVE